MIGDVYRTADGDYYQMLCTGVLADKPTADWEPVVVLQMLAAPWGVIVVKEKDWDENWDVLRMRDGDLVLLGSEIRRAKQMRQGEPDWEREAEILKHWGEPYPYSSGNI